MISVGSKKQTSQESSKPLTPEQVRGYFSDVDSISGGRLGEFARTGTGATDYRGFALAGESADGRPTIEAASYQELTPDQLRSLGGAGETRRAAIERSRGRAREEIAADPSLSVAQRFRARQLTDEGASTDLDAVNRETEALLTQLAGGERQQSFAADAARAEAVNKISSEELSRRYQAELAKAGLTAADLDQLAQIYYGGKGTTSTGYSKGTGPSFSFLTG